MGCDIHTYVEHRKPGAEYWSGWPRIDPGRDYELFGHLAGVRSDVAPIVAPRGIPDGQGSFYRDGDYWLLVNDKYADEEGRTSRAKAEQWTASGSSVWRNEKREQVSDPDAHTASWMTADEFERAVLMPSEWGRDPEYHAVIGAMRALESQGREVRIVFWFDN